MASLTEVAYYSRKIIVFSFLLITVTIIAWIGTTSFISYWKKTHPPPPPPPNVKFGLLPKIKFPNQAIPENLQIKQETATGSFKQSSPSARVFFIPKTTTTFFAPDKARAKAQLFGFDNEPIILNKDLYQWIDSNHPLRKLTLNINNFHLTLTYNVAGDVNLAKQKQLPDKTQAQKKAQDLINNFALSSPDLQYPPLVNYLKWENNQFIPIESLNQANFVEIKFIRSPTSFGPFVYPPNQAPIRIILSGSKVKEKEITLLEYLYNIIDYEIYATYPLKTVQQAFEELKQKKAYFNNYQKNTAVVRSAELGYYEELDSQTYLQPVYVFRGDDNFKAYVPAIENEWLKEAPTAK